MKTLEKLVTLAAVMTYVLIVLGGTIRVFEAGLSCPDWPLCYGQFIPFPAPVGGFESEGVRYSAFQVSLEWSHRLLASLIGFVMLGIGWLAFKHRAEKKGVLTGAVVSLLLLASQVKLGGVTVILDNVNWSVALHLGNAMLFFGSLIVLRRLVARPVGQKGLDCGYWSVLLAGMVATAVLVTMLMGVMVSKSFAGGVCGGLFSCMGEWLPKDDIGQLLHMKHRYLALMTFVLVSAFFVVTGREDKPLQASGKGLLILVCGQVALGIATLYSFAYYPEFYRPLSVAHLAWGTLLWMACVGVLCKIYLGAGGGFHKVK